MKPPDQILLFNFKYIAVLVATIARVKEVLDAYASSIDSARGDFAISTGTKGLSLATTRKGEISDRCLQNWV